MENLNSEEKRSTSQEDPDKQKKIDKEEESRRVELKPKVKAHELSKREVIKKKKEENEKNNKRRKHKLGGPSQRLPPTHHQ